MKSSPISLPPLRSPCGSRTSSRPMSRPITCPALVAYRTRPAHRSSFTSWAPVEFPHLTVEDGERLDLGNVSLSILHTPGHTPDSVSILVTDKTRASEPWFVLTGDTLFSGGVGRPDLIGAGSEAMLAEQHESLGRIMTLPDHFEIFPAHFWGAACGKGLSGKPGSTIGFERRFNPAFKPNREPSSWTSSWPVFRLSPRFCGESPAQLDRHMSEMRLGLRENFPQFALLVVLNSFVEPWSAWSEPCCRSWANRSSASSRRPPSPHRELRCDEGGHQPRCARASDRVGRNPSWWSDGCSHFRSLS